MVKKSWPNSNYTDHDFFSIDLFRGGELKHNPKTYIGGSVDYIDTCNVDQFSLIETMSIMKDRGEATGALTFWYRFPGEDKEKGLFQLDYGFDVTMCRFLLQSGFDVYVIITDPSSQATDAQHDLRSNDSKTCPPKVSDDIMKAIAERTSLQPKETTVRCKKTGHNTTSSSAAESKPEKLSESRRKRKPMLSSKQNEAKKSATLWSEEDDISLLKGMVDNEVQQQSNPSDDMGKFLDFVKLSKITKAWGHDVAGGKGENVVTSGDDQNVVVDDVDCGKRSKVIKNKKKGKVVISNGQNSPEDNVVVGDVHGDKCSEVVINKKKGKVEISDGQNVTQDHVVEDEVDGGKSEQVVKDKKKVLINDRQNEKLVVDDVNSGKCSKVDNDKKSGEVVIIGGQNVEAENLVVDDVGGGKCTIALKDEKKRKGVISDGQSAKRNGKKRVKVVGNDVEVENVVVDDVGGGKCSELVKDKKKKKVVFSDGQSSKKKGKKRVKVVGDENVPREVLKKDLKDFTSMYPHLTKSLELETLPMMLSMMPLHIKKNFVMDIINSMGREKANELEEKWIGLHLMEIELHAKKLDMTNKQIKLILEVMRR